MKPAVTKGWARQTDAYAPSAADSSSTLDPFLSAVGATTSPYAMPSSSGVFYGRDTKPDGGPVFFTNPALVALSISLVSGIRYYTMIGRDSLTDLWVLPWIVEGSPDTTGARYPGPGTVNPATISILNNWAQQ